MSKQTWLVKSDPEEYSAADLERDGETLWEGVRNAAAQIHLRAMKIGDEVLVYHTGEQRAVVALARVAAPPQPDPGDDSPRSVAVQLAFERWLTQPVTLADIKARPDLADFALVRIGRLSVMPVTGAQRNVLLQMAQSTGR